MFSYIGINWPQPLLLGVFFCPFLVSLPYAELFWMKSWPQRDFGIDFWLEQADELTFGFFQTEWTWGTRREERILEKKWKLLPWLTDWLHAFGSQRQGTTCGLCRWFSSQNIFTGEEDIMRLCCILYLKCM